AMPARALSLGMLGPFRRGGFMAAHRRWAAFGGLGDVPAGEALGGAGDGVVVVVEEVDAVVGAFALVGLALEVAVGVVGAADELAAVALGGQVGDHGADVAHALSPPVVALMPVGLHSFWGSTGWPGRALPCPPRAAWLVPGDPELALEREC